MTMRKAKKKRTDNAEPMDVDDSLQDFETGEGSNTNKKCQQNGDLGDIDHISDEEEGGMRVGDIYIPPAPKPALTFDSTGPRLIITHIVNENFKSYAGVQALGPFHKSFTAIIGPNGSGKSNVIDSMLFVFGYRASKIRSKKISSLIHVSPMHPNVNSARVEVHFCQIIDDEGENFTVVPNSEIVVSRTAFKDNSSFYTLNGARVHFKEVAKMLRSYGIDLDHNRFLILQGEVEQIAMMKPKAEKENDCGMLEYLEDIIGTSRYKEPIVKLAEKVEEYSEARKEKLNRVRLVENEKQKLEQPMKVAVEQTNLTNAASRTNNMLLQKYIYENSKIIETKMSELAELKEKRDVIDEKLNKIKEELQQKNTILKTGSQKYEKLHNKKDEITDKLQKCKRKSVTVQADTSQSNKKKKNLQQLLEQEKTKLIDLEMVPEKNKKEIEECEKLLEDHRSKKAEAEEEFQALMVSVRAKTQGLQDTKDKLQSKLMELKKIVNDADHIFKVADSELKLYLSSEVAENEKLERLKEAYEDATRKLRDKKGSHKNLCVIVSDKEKEMSQMQTQLQNLKREESSIVPEIRSLRSKLEESREAFTANRSRGRVLDSLMREKQNGNLPGIFGRLGDLGGIDAKYDIAISTCCGALDNIVADSADTAQACINFLKRNDLGQATFIALDKVQHLAEQCRRKETYPENAPRLFDLIKIEDERTLPAFYFALRDTLVATDLEQATRIAYGRRRFRVVTLKGEVIEVAGTMTGGKETYRGRMGRSVQQKTKDQDPRALKLQEEKLASLENRLKDMNLEQSSLEDTMSNLQRSVLEGKTTLNKLNVEMKSLTEQGPVLKNQIKNQEEKAASSKVDMRQKAKLEKVVKEAEQKLDKAKKDAAQIEKQVEEVDNKIAAVASSKVKDLQKHINELTNKIDKISTSISKLRVAINTSVRNAKKSKDKINQMEAELKETENNLENLNTQKKQITLESAQYQKEIEEIQEQIDEGSGEFTELKQEIAKLQSKENKGKAARLEAHNAVCEVEKKIQSCKDKTPVWQNDINKIRLEDPGLVDDNLGLEKATPLETHTSEELEAVTVEELRNKLAAQRARLGEAKPNLQAILDYYAKQELYFKRAAELDEITTKRNDMRALYDQLRKRRTTEFLSGFNTITGKLKEMYQMITLGGDADLELIDSLDPFNEGVQFSVRPPNKSWKNISNLSGGEKTLSSLALVFALHYYKPTPLYFMDEIDAALDFKNISIVANYIKERTKNAQFIIISLRNNMFEISNRLVGIYKTEDCTKSVAIENKMPVITPAPPLTDNATNISNCD